MRSSNPKEDRSEHLLILTLACAALLGSFILQPSAQGGLRVPLHFLGGPIQLPEICMSRRLFNMPCPGCGLTRSFVAVSRGKIQEAFRFNLMGPIIYLVCLFQIPYRLVELLHLGSTNTVWISIKQRLDTVTWLILIGLIATWVIKVV
jgi:hypothetical protein